MSEIVLGRTEGVSYGAKVEVTTSCPTCLQPWKRMVYEQGLIAGCVLDMCPKCVAANSDEDGNYCIMLTKRW